MQPLFILTSWLPVFVWAGLIFYLSSIPHLSTGWGFWDLILRKMAHVVEYFILAFFLLRASRKTWPSLSRGLLLVGAGVTAVLYAMSDEVHQAFVPGRGPSVRDVLIDSSGVVLCLVFCWKTWGRCFEDQFRSVDAHDR